MSTHSSGCWPEIAIEDWVRGSASMAPLRTPEQLRQLQFHWGNPPPAADPSMVIFTIQRKSPRSARAFVYRQGDQRFEMYMVISMPNRRSIAQGVSQVMMLSSQ